jgi:uncharacterized protein YdhG (YjbR/CyaY superfamily)
MSASEIDEYLDHLDEPKRSTLSQLRSDILAVVPHAEQCISYAVPGFKVAGKTIAGFAAFKNHLSYLPHSGSVFPELAEELAGYEKSSGAFAIPHPPAATSPVGRETDRRADPASLSSGRCAGERRGVTRAACLSRTR